MKDDQNQEIEQLINENQNANDAEMAALNNEHQRNREADAIRNNNINNFINNMANEAVPDDDAELNDLQNRVNEENQLNNQDNPNNRENAEDAVLNEQINQLNQEIAREDDELLERANRNLQNQNLQNQNLQNQNARNQINNLNASAQRMRAAEQGMENAAANIERNRNAEQRRQRQQEIQRQQEEARRIREQNRQQVREMLRQQQNERERQAAERRRQEETADFMRNVYRSGRDNVVTRANKGYEDVIKYFVPDEGYIYPQGLTPELTAAAVIGAAIDPDWLKDNVPEKIMEAGSVTNLQKKILNDVMNGGQIDPAIGDIVMKAFPRVNAAVAEYAAGNDIKFKDFLQTYADYSARTVGDIKAADANLSDGFNPEQLSYKFCKDIVIDGPLRVEPNRVDFTEINKLKLNSLSKQMDAMKAAEQRKQRLINEVGALTGAQKEELVSEMLLDNYIANMASINKSKLDAEVKKNRENTFKNIGINEQDPKWNNYTAEKNNAIAHKAKEAAYIINSNSISEFDVLMEIPGARESLKLEYMAKIKESEVYRNIVNAQNPKTMIDSLLAADREAAKGMNAIPGFKMDPVIKTRAKELNDRYRPKLEEGLSKVNKEMVYQAMGEATFNDAIMNDSMRMDSLDHDDVVANAQEINDLYQTIKKNDTITGSRNYGDMKNALKELRDYTRKVAGHNSPMGRAEVVKYKKLVDDVNKQADHYLMNKKNLDDPSSSEKVAGVRLMKKKLLSSIRKIDLDLDNTMADKNTELFGNRFRLFDHLNPARESNNPFYGEKYYKPGSRKINNGAGSAFTTERTAGTSIAIMCMAASGKYSFEDIMNPVNCIKEKRAIYDDVMRTLKDGDNPASREKIARMIRDGRKATERMLDEQVKKIDFKNVDIYKDKHFLMTLHMYQARFDVEQEMMRIMPDYIKVAKELDPNFRDMRDTKVIWSPMLEIHQAMGKLRNCAYDAETATNPVEAANSASKLMAGTEIIRRDLELMDKKQQTGRNTPVHEWFSEQEHAELTVTGAGLEKAIYDKMPFSEHPEDIKPLLPKMIDGSLTKDIKYELDVVKGGTKITSGVPSKENIHTEAANTEFLKKTDEAIRRLEGGQENYRSKKDFVLDSAYAIFGQMYRAAGMHTPIDATTGQKLTLEEFMKKQIKSGVFEKSLKSKKNPKRFTDPKNIAKMAKDPKQMNKIIKAHTEKNAERNTSKTRQKSNQRSTPAVHH